MAASQVKARTHTDASDTGTVKTLRGKGKGKENVQEVGKSKKGRSTKKFPTSNGPPNKIAEGSEEDSWSWTTIADSSISNRSVVFTVDGSYFFSVVGSSIRIYSTSTGKVVSTLSSSASSSASSGSRVPNGRGHTDIITSVLLNPSNPYQLITASLDGFIKIWDYLEAVLLQSIEFGRPICHMCAHEKFNEQVFIATLTKTERRGDSSVNQEKGNTMIYRVSLKPSPILSDSGAHRFAEVVRVGKTRAAVSLGLSHNGAWLVAIAGFKAYVAMTSSLESGFTKFVSPEKLTCLAFHPEDDFFATGDEKGQIRLWYCLNSQISFNTAGGEKRAQTTTMHWHAHAVSSLSFTGNGAYLLSGGEESVLVIWQLQTGKKEFVPRLGSPIINISVRSGSEEEYLLGLADGNYVFIGASSLTVTRSISRVRLDVGSRSGPISGQLVPFALHSVTSTIILPSSHPSSLQIYSPSTSSLVSELEVSPSNRVSKRDETPIEPFRVEQAAIAPGGQWMATLDKRDNDDDFSSEVYLKFWKWKSSTWVLNTRIDRPHGTKAVKTIAFCPRPESQSGLLLVTAGLDGNVKFWRIRSVTSKDGSIDDFWISRSSFTFRSDIPQDISWSLDGSLLAAVFGSHIIILDPVSNSSLDSLDTAEVKNPERVRFLGQSGRYLLVFNKNDVVLWDLVSRTVRWYYRTPSFIIHALAHPRRDTVAIFLHPYAEFGDVRTTMVYLFHASSPTPLMCKPLPFRFRALSWSSSLDDANLVGITDSWNIVRVGDTGHPSAEEEFVPMAIGRDAASVAHRTIFQDIFGASALTTLPPVQSSQPASVQQDPAGAYSALASFSAPAYLAPPIESLYPSLLHCYLSTVPEPLVAPDTRDETEEGMVIDTDVPISSASKIVRSVDDRELESLVSLFQSQDICVPVSRKLTNGMANGRHKVDSNGVRPPTPLKSPNINGHMPTKSAARDDMNGQVVSVQSSSPVVVGKKRKKGAVV